MDRLLVIDSRSKHESDRATLAPEESAMARLYREHNEALIRFLMTRVSSEHEARDVAQEAYVRMLQLEAPETVSFLSAYLFRTAAHIAVDRSRRRVVQGRAIADLSARGQSEQVTLDRALEARQQLELIGRFVQELPPKCREAFYLHRLESLPPPQIAAQLGVTKRMVHHYLVRAMAHIQARLDAATQARNGADE
jgi:RNA polymerase sigma factor (sigma-70 family)